VATIILPVSGLRRCQECLDAMGLGVQSPPAVTPPQPEIEGIRTGAPTTQPTVVRRRRTWTPFDYKRAQGKDDEDA
jgi:hypothetical protein